MTTALALHSARIAAGQLVTELEQSHLRRAAYERDADRRRVLLTVGLCAAADWEYGSAVGRMIASVQGVLTLIGAQMPEPVRVRDVEKPSAHYALYEYTCLWHDLAGMWGFVKFLREAIRPLLVPDYLSNITDTIEWPIVSHLLECHLLTIEPSPDAAKAASNRWPNLLPGLNRLSRDAYPKLPDPIFGALTTHAKDTMRFRRDWLLSQLEIEYSRADVAARTVPASPIAWSKFTEKKVLAAILGLSPRSNLVKSGEKAGFIVEGKGKGLWRVRLDSLDHATRKRIEDGLA